MYICHRRHQNQLISSNTTHCPAHLTPTSASNIAVRGTLREGRDNPGAERTWDTLPCVRAQLNMYIRWVGSFGAKLCFSSACITLALQKISDHRGKTKNNNERRIIVRYRGGVGTHAASAPCKLFGSTATNRILLEQYTCSVPYWCIPHNSIFYNTFKKASTK